MRSSTTTTTLLLQGLRDPANSQAWAELDARFRPIITGFARGIGLCDADAADIAQQSLAEFARDYNAGQYNPSRGRLRTWLMSIARHSAAKVLAQRARRGLSLPMGAAAEIQDPASDARLTAIWNLEHERAVANEALRRLRTETRLANHTIRAFELTALQAMTPEQAAAECGMTVAEVYVARKRVAEKLKELVAAVQGAWEER